MHGTVTDKMEGEQTNLINNASTTAVNESDSNECEFGLKACGFLTLKGVVRVCQKTAPVIFKVSSFLPSSLINILFKCFQLIHNNIFIGWIW